MLTVQVNESTPQSLEKSELNLLIIDEAAISTRNIELPSDDQLLFGIPLQALAVDHAFEFSHGTVKPAGPGSIPDGSDVEIEVRFDTSDVFSGPNQLPRHDTFTEDSRECGHDNGLARTSFTGKNVEAGAEIDSEMMDDRDVVDGQCGEHGYLDPELRLQSYLWRKFVQKIKVSNSIVRIPGPL